MLIWLGVVFAFVGLLWWNRPIPLDPKKPNYTLPNGLQVWGSTLFDTLAVYYEMFVELAYFKHGIKVKSGDTVLDIGANTGMFSIFMSKHAPNVRLHCFEPIPETFRALELNCKKYFSKQAVLHQCGVSLRPSQAEFHYDPFLSINAGMYHESLWAVALKNSLLTWLKASVTDMKLVHMIPDSVANVMIAILSTPVLNWLTVILLLPFVFVYLVFVVVRSVLYSKKVSCQLKTLSQVMNEQRIDKVSLLKVDVEGAELDVLLGITEEKHWNAIDQIVLEVHDLEKRVETITTLLEKHGFRVWVEQEDWETHKLFKIYTVFAKRVELCQPDD
eukprot:TRINITY_DN3628_c0_g1_i1.p1 TRINITY_DN3628_c0_g1~~TRINITY_DN3628_c0_g1_i1.p1  ORF type:complete len:331 (+),score=53.21 TRINITY_DN3628_c0_g1_i1:69-1061(+)